MRTYHVMVDQIDIPEGDIRLNRWTTVTNGPLFAWSLLRRLVTLCEKLPEMTEQQRRTSDDLLMAAEWLEELRKVGVQVRIEKRG